MRTRANKAELFKKTDICLKKRTFQEGMRIPPTRNATTAREVAEFRQNHGQQNHFIREWRAAARFVILGGFIVLA
jgi:hypothetical protein